MAIEFQLGLWLLHRKPSLWEHPDRFDPVGLAPTASISECTQRFNPKAVFRIALEPGRFFGSMGAPKSF